jgi:hypothetical protein
MLDQFGDECTAMVRPVNLTHRDGEKMALCVTRLVASSFPRKRESRLLVG